MLLTQKAFAEGGLAMTLDASSLYEDIQTGATVEARENASMVLDLITPVVKSWPAKYCLEANDMAIQVLGGAGYIREHLVEQYYRDNRLNPIHEGTEGIQGIDLLGRKAGSHAGQALTTLLSWICSDAEAAIHSNDIENLGKALLKAAVDVESVTSELLLVVADDRERGLANATVYLHYFGRLFAAWIWTLQALKASKGLSCSEVGGVDYAFYKGKLQTAQYYINWELPKMEHERAILLGAYAEPFEMKNEWF
jgi:butyryl-CoA dehydrogenase